MTWLAHQGPNGAKHKGWRHPLATFLIHYSVVACTTIFFHDLLVGMAVSHSGDNMQCSTLNTELGERQLRVSSFLAIYFGLYFAWRLALQWNERNTYLLFPEFYRQTFLCSGTIFNAALTFYTNRPLRAEAFCIAVGIDQLLW